MICVDATPQRKGLRVSGTSIGGYSYKRGTALVVVSADIRTGEIVRGVLAIPPILQQFSTAALCSLRNLFMHHQASQNQSEVVQPMISPQAGSRSPRWTQIRCLCDAIAGEFQPEKIVLCGSYAYDTPRPDSDVDLLVIMPFEGSPFRQAAVI